MGEVDGIRWRLVFLEKGVKLFEELHAFKEVAWVMTVVLLIMPSEWDALLPQKCGYSHNALQVLPPLCYFCCTCSIQLLNHIPMTLCAFKALPTGHACHVKGTFLMLTEGIQSPFPI